MAIENLEWWVSDYNNPIHLNTEFIDELQEQYPELDIRKQIENAHEWATNNHEEETTAKGVITFIRRWVKRSQDDISKEKKYFRRSMDA